MIPEQEKQWDNLYRRIHSFASRQCRGRGTAVVTVRLLVADGELRSWSEPEAVFFEPRGNCQEIADAILRHLSSNG